VSPSDQPAGGTDAGAGVDQRDMLAETVAFNDALERELAAMPSVHTLPAEVTREARRNGKGVFPPPVFLPEARDVEIPGRAGPIRLRVLEPEGTATGAFLHIHGGGWTLGAHDLQDVALAELAHATGLCAVSVDYRLAPEHPFPAGPDDCEDAARWLLDGGASELGVPARLAIGGESAGGHLSALTLLRLREQRGDCGFDAVVFTYGAFDLSMTPSQRLWGERNLVLSEPILLWFGDCFLPGLDRERRRGADISPLFADLHGLPPALFTVGTLDALLDDTLFMEARWRAAGNVAELHVWPEAIHGFTGFDLSVASAARAAEHAFLRTVLAAG
jgi:acetyl esterase/lipase